MYRIAILVAINLIHITVSDPAKCCPQRQIAVNITTPNHTVIRCVDDTKISRQGETNATDNYSHLVNDPTALHSFLDAPSNVCVDKFMDSNRHVRLGCLSTDQPCDVARFRSRIRTVRKCCPLDYDYDVSTKSCQRSSDDDPEVERSIEYVFTTYESRVKTGFQVLSQLLEEEAKDNRSTEEVIDELLAVDGILLPLEHDGSETVVVLLNDEGLRIRKKIVQTVRRLDRMDAEGLRPKIEQIIRKYTNNLSEPLVNSYDFIPLSKNLQPKTRSVQDMIKYFGLNETLVDFSIGIENCEDFSVDIRLGSKFQARFQRESVYITGRTERSYDRYCLDREYDPKGGSASRYIVKICENLKHTMSTYKMDGIISKCCPEGSSYVQYREPNVVRPRVKCQPSMIPFRPNFSEPSGSSDTFKTVAVENFTTTAGIECTVGKYLLDPQIDRYAIYRNGTLLEVDSRELTPVYPNKNYCTDNVINVNGHVRTYTFRCFHTAAGVPDSGILKVYAVVDMISCCFLAATLLVYGCLKELQNLHGRTLMCHVFSLFMSFLWLALTMLVKIHVKYCAIYGFIILFFFLSAFSWLNVMCFDIWWTFGNHRISSQMSQIQDRRRFVYYNLYAWGVALVITISAYITDQYELLPLALRPGIGLERCFFAKTIHNTKTYGHFLFFIAPILVQTVFNVVFFVRTSQHCNEVKSEIHRMQAGSKGQMRKKRFYSDKSRLIMNGKLFIVMGVSWTHEILSSFFVQPEWLWYFGDVINCALGVPIFVIFVLKPKVWRLIKTKLGVLFKPQRTIRLNLSTVTTTSLDKRRTFFVKKNSTSSNMTLTTNSLYNSSNV